VSGVAGKTVVVTGATSGIGLVVAGTLSRMGANLVLVARDPAKGGPLAARLKARVLYADLSSLADMRRVAGEICTATPRLDVLLNNAGAIFARREVTADGLERTFALNHMAYYLLTRLLHDRFGPDARIVNVASEAHRTATLDFADLQTARGYSGWLAYRRSKLANLLFTRALARRLAGSGITANALHPGFVATSFGDNNRGVFRFGVGLAKRFGAISTEAGAETPVYLASSPGVAGVSGLYFDKRKACAPSAAALDDAAAERLWASSAAFVGLPPD
jgi:NAD(P)-dependent dehydrogenase (short-subunit alcohol dehydrogenase family)